MCKCYTWYPRSDEEPILLLRVHEIVKLLCEELITIGRLGDPGRVVASGERKKATLGLVGDSSLNVALQVALPLREDATHVYTPSSLLTRSKKLIQKVMKLQLTWTLIFINFQIIKRYEILLVIVYVLFPFCSQI